MRNKYRIRTFIYKEWFLITLIIILFTSFLGNKGWYLCLLLTPLMLFKIKLNEYVDKTFILIVLFSFLYVTFLFLHGLSSDSKGMYIFHLIYPSTFYIIGRYFMKRWYSQRYFVFFFILFSLALPSLLSIYWDIFQNGFINQTRSVVDFFNDDGSQVATLLGVRLSLFISAGSMILITNINNIERKYRYIYFAFGVLSLIGVIHLINRTGIVVFIISFATLFLYSFRNKETKRYYLSIFIIVLLLCLSVYFILTNPDIVEVYLMRSGDDKSNLYSAGGRLDLWLKGFKSLFIQPLGGGVFKYGARTYAHNFWLDVGELTGVFPFIFLMIISIKSFKKNVFLVLNEDYITTFFAAFLITINAGFLLTHLVEPTYEGAPVFVYAYFCFIGMTNSLYDKIKKCELKTKG